MPTATAPVMPLLLPERAPEVGVVCRAQRLGDGGEVSAPGGIQGRRRWGWCAGRWVWERGGGGECKGGSKRRCMQGVGSGGQLASQGIPGPATHSPSPLPAHHPFPAPPPPPSWIPSPHHSPPWPWHCPPAQVPAPPCQSGLSAWCLRRSRHCPGRSPWRCPHQSGPQPGRRWPRGLHLRRRCWWWWQLQGT
jgi:hypothetical protein